MIIKGDNMELEYQQARVALNKIGVTGAPTLQQIKANLTDKQKRYIKKNNCTLVITPALSLEELVKEFDKQAPRETYVYSALWDQYDLGSDVRVDFVHPELHFTSQTYDQQRDSLRTAQKSVKGLQSIDPRTYVMLQLLSKEPTDETTWMRFVQLDKKKVVGDSIVGRVYSFDGLLLFSWSFGYAYSYGGVGLSVELNLSTLSLPVSSAVTFPLSSNDLQENTKALNRLGDILEKVFKK